MARLLRDTCPLAAEILEGKHDENLEDIKQACTARLKSQFRRGARVRLHGTRNPQLEGREGTVIKVNPSRVTVGLGERDQFGYPEEFNVPPSMLEVVHS